MYARFLITDTLVEEIMDKINAENEYTVDIKSAFQDEEELFMQR